MRSKDQPRVTPYPNPRPNRRPNPRSYPRHGPPRNPSLTPPYLPPKVRVRIHRRGSCRDCQRCQSCRASGRASRKTSARGARTRWATLLGGLLAEGGLLAGLGVVRIDSLVAEMREEETFLEAWIWSSVCGRPSCLEWTTPRCSSSMTCARPTNGSSRRATSLISWRVTTGLLTWGIRSLCLSTSGRWSRRDSPTSSSLVRARANSSKAAPPGRKGATARGSGSSHDRRGLARPS